MAQTKNIDEVAEAYNSEPWWYDLRGLMILTFAYNYIITFLFSFFSRNMGTNHLEVAVGSGTFMSWVLFWRRLFSRQVMPNKIVGVDYAKAMLYGATNRFHNKKDQISFVHADAAQMPFEDQTFDTANLANSIHCIPDARGAIKEIFRVLKPGGSFASNVLLYPDGYQSLKFISEKVNSWAISKGILVSPFTVDQYLHLLTSAGFEILSSDKFGNNLNVIAMRPAEGRSSNKHGNPSYFNSDHCTPELAFEPKH